MGNSYKKKVAARKTKATATPWEEQEMKLNTPARQGVLKVVPKTVNQKAYLDAIEAANMVFAIGPAGTGKTFLAVAKAVQWLAHRENRLVLVRPAVEAGEKLGFLPGTMQEKVDPYLRPIYDALYSMMPPQQVEHYIDNGKIEIAALAFMRGRTLSNSFVIFDEAQNSTKEQMKMMLTRIGENSKMVINGDVTQIDPPLQAGEGRYQSGLLHAEKILEGRSDNILFQYFEEEDIVRHPLVQEVCRLYDEGEAEENGSD
jgi:phosphate starvation-inducible PhoH-like protein